MKYLCESCVNFPCTKDMNMMEMSCPVYSPKPKPITNYDRLRAMSVEEMAEFLTLIMMGEERSVPFIYSTVDKWLDWLRQGAE